MEIYANNGYNHLRLLQPAIYIKKMNKHTNYYQLLLHNTTTAPTTTTTKHSHSHQLDKLHLKLTKPTPKFMP